MKRRSRFPLLPLTLSIGLAFSALNTLAASPCADNTAANQDKGQGAELKSPHLPGGNADQNLLMHRINFPSEQAAVIAATNYFNPLSILEDREYMGAVLRSLTEPDTYIYTAAPGQVGQDRIQVKIAVPANFEIIAFWHTHGGPHYSRRYFSDTDTALVRQWQRPFYLADYRGALRVFRPGDKTLAANRARRLGLGHNHGFAKGKPVRDSHTNRTIRVATRIESLKTQMLAQSRQGVCRSLAFRGNGHLG